MKKFIVLLTDFGIDDVYVGIMKGVIYRISPNTNIIDLTHNIQPQNIKQAAFLLATSYKFFPSGTIFCTIIDPGVGSGCEHIALKYKGRYFVAPNNGVLTYLLKAGKPITKVVKLDNADYHLKNISNTFHGRDIYAPISAFLANKVNLSELGTDFEAVKIIKLAPLKNEIYDNNFHGEIIHIDHFGNLITSLKAETIQKNQLSSDYLMLQFGDLQLMKLHKTYSDVPVGKFVVYKGSSGFIEIGIREGNASKNLKAEIGMEISIKLLKE